MLNSDLSHEMPIGRLETETEGQAVARVSLHRAIARDAIEHFRNGVERSRLGSEQIAAYLRQAHPMPMISRPIRVRLSTGALVSYQPDAFIVHEAGGCVYPVAIAIEAKRIVEYVGTSEDIAALGACVRGVHERVRMEESDV
jgi:hypothetical protein